MALLKKDKLQIIGFQSYGNTDRAYLRGRALEDEEIDLEQKGFFSLLHNTWKRFETDEIKHAKIGISLDNGVQLSTETDSHGYFKINEVVENLSELSNSEGWIHGELSFLEGDLKREILHQNKFPIEMLIPKPSVEFGIISDIDDTILHTGVVSSLKWKVLFNTFFKRASSRKALEGTAEFYHKLHLGKSGTAANPIFYVSHSPWNLYRYLEHFLKINKFPKGPILLRSMASFRNRKKQHGKPQKHIEIENILKTYPDMSFILIGDSGERDADIYMDVSKNFPNRIKSIYLRSVNDKRRVERVKKLFLDYTDVPFLLVDKTDKATLDAFERGFIK